MKKVLVIDDEDTTCELYAEELRDEDYDVVTTGDGAGLIEMMDQR